MGFGTLFVGYFFLLNITYYAFTDIIASLVMLLGLYKLSSVNKPFKVSSYICIGFCLFALVEFINGALGMFGGGFGSDLLTYLAIIRYVLVAALSLFVLAGIREVSREVGLYVNEARAKMLIYTALIVYTLLIALELPLLTGLIPFEATALIATATIILELLYIIFTLVLIYSSHMKICMPEDNLPKEEKPSRFGFVNEYRRRKAEKDKRYAEYKLEKMKRKKGGKGK